MCSNGETISVQDHHNLNRLQSLWTTPSPDLIHCLRTCSRCSPLSLPSQRLVSAAPHGTSPSRVSPWLLLSRIYNRVRLLLTGHLDGNCDNLTTSWPLMLSMLCQRSRSLRDRHWRHKPVLWNDYLKVRCEPWRTEGELRKRLYRSEGLISCHSTSQQIQTNNATSSLGEHRFQNLKILIPNDKVCIMSWRDV